MPQTLEELDEAFQVGASGANSCGRPSTTGEQGVPSGVVSEAQLGTDCRQRSAADHGRVPQILGNIDEVAQLGPQVRVLVDLPVPQILEEVDEAAQLGPQE